jgi:16S rRNA (adenine1518-N6/adenine1519-N6)-dimethyltransferase
MRADPASPRLRRAKKSLGQHFLLHARIAERIVLAANLPTFATVVEIGPGTGILTRELLKKATTVVGIEADAGLLKTLEEELKEEIATKTFQPILADIRTFAIETLPPQYAVVANIPYYLTGEILRRFLTAKEQPLSMTLLVQKEVAERIARSKKESLLSLSVKAYGTPHYEFKVPRGAFLPAPKVDSAVLRISDISRKNFKSPEHEKRFFTYLKAGFGQKRKRLAKNLTAAGLRAPEELKNLRAEDLSLGAWLTLSEQS